MKDYNSRWFAFEWVRVAVVLGVTLLVYSNIFANDFVGDDRDFIVDWEVNKSFVNIPKLFQGAVPEGHEGVYRPLRGIAYMAAYQLFGTEVWDYHLISLIVHLSVTLLVYGLIKEITKQNLTAFLAALVFGVHPVHVEAITYITTAFDEIGIAFFMLSVWFYVRWRTKRDLPSGLEITKKWLKDSLEVKKVRKQFYWFSVVCAGITIFWYEFGLILPLILMLIDISIYRYRIKDFKWKTYLPYFLLIGVYGYIRFGVLEIAARAPYQANSFYLTQLATLKALVKYWQLLLVPVRLNISHMLPGGIATHTLIEVNEAAIRSQSITDATVWLSMVWVVGLLILAVKARKKWPMVTLVVGWVFISLLPVMNLFPNSALLQEKYVYLASVGYALLVGWGVSLLIGQSGSNPESRSIKDWLTTRFRIRSGMIKKIRVSVITASMLYVSWLGYQTYERNKDWRNEVMIWEKTVTQSPENPLVHYKLGSAYRDVGELDKAKAAYETSLAMYPKLVEAMNNLGVIAEKEGDWELASNYYRQALGLRPMMPELHNNLGVIYLRQEEYAQAVQELTQVLRLNPDYRQARVNLAKAYVSWGDEYWEEKKTVMAKGMYKEALRVFPGFEIAVQALAKIEGE